MKLSETPSERRIELSSQSTCKNDIIADLVNLAVADGRLHDPQAFIGKILDREALHSTGLVEGIAIPHAQDSDVEEVIACVGVCREGIAFDAIDSKLVQIVFLIVANVDRNAAYLSLLNQIVRILGDASVRERVLLAQSPYEVIQIIAKAEEKFPEPSVRGSNEAI